MDIPYSTRVDDIEQELIEFRTFLGLKKNLTRKVVNGHCSKIRRFLCSYHGLVSPQTIEEYLTRIKEKLNIKTYANYICSFRKYTRDFKGLEYVDDYDLPRIKEEPIIVPPKEEIRSLFGALPNAKIVGTTVE